MDYRDIFGTNRTRRRRRSRLNRTGEPVDLLQLMRRRVRYRPYALNRLRSRSRELEVTNYDSNLSQNSNFLPESQSSSRDVLGLYGNIECRDVSTNTEYPCCSGSSSVAKRSATTSSASKPTNFESHKSSVEPVSKRRSQQSSVGIVKNNISSAQTQNDNKNVGASMSGEEQPGVSTKDLPIKSNSNVTTGSDVKSVINHQQSSSCTVTDSTDLSSDTIDGSSHNSSLVVERNTSGESLTMVTPPTIAYIEVHHSSSQEHISTSDSSLNHVIGSLPLIAPVDVEADAEAGGDGHHNDSVLQFEITLTTAIPDIEEDMIENDEEDEHNDDDDDNDIEIIYNDDDDDNEIDDNDNDNEVEEVEEEEQGVED